MSSTYRADIRVTFKPTVNDPQSETITRALGRLGFGGIENLSAGKFFDVTLQADDQASAEKQIDAMCEKLLANPVIERYLYDISKVE